MVKANGDLQRQKPLTIYERSSTEANGDNNERIMGKTFSSNIAS
jgi:hypothetical protein